MGPQPPSDNGSQTTNDRDVEPKKDPWARKPEGLINKTENALFYADRLTMSVHHTMGGLAINLSATVTVTRLMVFMLLERVLWKEASISYREKIQQGRSQVDRPCVKNKYSGIKLIHWLWHLIHPAYFYQKIFCV